MIPVYNQRTLFGKSPQVLLMKRERDQNKFRAFAHFVEMYSV